MSEPHQHLQTLLLQLLPADHSAVGNPTLWAQFQATALGQWVQAVNAHGGFSTWAWDVVVGDAAGMQDAVARHG